MAEVWAEPVRIEFLQQDEDEFVRFDAREDWTKRAPEELIEAALAVFHHDRGKQGVQETIDEMADGIISAVHVAWHIAGCTPGGVRVLNDAIERKLKKANAHG